MKWVYTDKAEISNEENFLVDLVKAANRYKLSELRARYDNNKIPIIYHRMLQVMYKNSFN